MTFMNESKFCPSFRRFSHYDNLDYPARSFDSLFSSRISPGLHPSTSYATCHSTTACVGDDVGDAQSVISTQLSESESFPYENNTEEQFDGECCGCSASSESLDTEKSKISIPTNSTINSQPSEDYSQSFLSTENHIPSLDKFSKNTSKITDVSGDKPSGLLTWSKDKKPEISYLPFLFLFYITFFLCLLYMYVAYGGPIRVDIPQDEWGAVSDRCTELQYLIFSEFFC